MEFEELKCPNCKEFFDTSNGKIPRLLINCGHSLCEICISEKLFTKDENGFSVINCIEDDEVYTHIKSVDQFPKNMTLIKLLNKSHETRTLMNSKSKNDSKNASYTTTYDQTELDYSSTNSLNTIENKKKALLSTPASKIKHRHNDATTQLYNTINDISTSYQFNSVIDEYTTIHDVDKANSRRGSKHASVLNTIDITPSVNRSSARVGLLKHDSRLHFNSEKNSKQVNQNCSSSHSSLKDEAAFCQEHANRRLELICLDDKIKICTNCALFGSHKKHNVISEEDFVKEIEVKAEILIDLFELIDNYTAAVRDSTFTDKFNILLDRSKQKSDAITKQVKDFIEELISNIKKSEHDILNNILRKNFEPINTKIRAARESPSEITAKAEEWKYQVQLKLDKLTEINDSSTSNGFSNQELSKLIDINVTNQETIAHAEEISNEFERVQAISTGAFEDMINKLSVEFNYELALKLNNIVHIVSPDENDKEPMNLDVQERKDTKEEKNLIEQGNNNNHRNMNNFINNIPMNMNNNFSLQSIATNTSDNIGNYFAGGENESIQGNNNSGNHSFLNLSEDSAIIRMNNINANNANKNIEINNTKEVTGTKHRNSNAAIANISVVNTTGNPSRANQAKSKTIICNANISTTTQINSNILNNFTSFNPSQSVIRPGNKADRLDNNSRLSPARDEEYSKSPTPDRDKIVFIKSQLKNEVANFTGYEIGEIGTKIITEILSSSASSSAKSSNPYKAKEIKLTKTNLNDESAFYILKSLEMNANVLTLNIAKNHLTDRCIEAIVSLLSKNKTLKTLYLSNNNFSTLAKDRIKSYGAGGKLKIFI